MFLSMSNAKRALYTRAQKRNKFGAHKYVYPAGTMRALRGWFEGEIAARFAQARVLYWT